MQYHHWPLAPLTEHTIRGRPFALLPASFAVLSGIGSSLPDFCSIMTIRFLSNKANQKIQSIAPHLICILIRCLCRLSYLSKSRYRSSPETVIIASIFHQDPWIWFAIVEEMWKPFEYAGIKTRERERERERELRVLRVFVSTNTLASQLFFYFQTLFSGGLRLIWSFLYWSKIKKIMIQVYPHIRFRPKKKRTFSFLQYKNLSWTCTFPLIIP